MPVGQVVVPQRVEVAPGGGAGVVDEVGGGADEVGDDGEETAVDLGLVGVWREGGREDVFGLGDGVEAVVVPGEGVGAGQVGAVGGLFDEGGAVPGEVGPLGDGFAVVGQALFGDAAAERVVLVVPGVAAGGGDGGEAVFGVPGVAPGVGFAGQPGLLPQG